MASNAAFAATKAAQAEAFSSMLQELSRSLGSQVRLAGGCLALHPHLPAGLRDATDQALAKLRTAVDEFSVDVSPVSGTLSGLSSLGKFPEDGRAMPHKAWTLLSPPEPTPRPRVSITLGDDEPVSLHDQCFSPECASIIPAARLWEAPEEDLTIKQGSGSRFESLDGSKRPAAAETIAATFSEISDSIAPLALRRSSTATERASTLPSELGMPAKMEHLCGDLVGAENSVNFGFAESMNSLREDQDHREPFSVKGVLNPNWAGRLGWDFGVIALVLVDAMVLPFQMAYKHGFDPDSFDTMWLVLTTLFFGMDICISFCTAYVAGRKDKYTEQGKLVTRRGRIAKHYLRGWFTIDFVSTIPWSVFADLMAGEDASGNSAQVAKLTKVVKFVRFLRLMRMLRLAKLGIIWERIEAKMGSLILLQIAALVRVLFIVVSICHWNACIWWMVGQPNSLITDMMSDEAQADWQAKEHWPTIKRSQDVDGESWSWVEKDKVEAYVFCFYWTLGVMRTMPSEVHPVNLVERVYVMLFMFFAVSAFAISVTLITQAFLKIGERRRIFNEDMAFARMHLRNIQASEQLQTKVKTYLTHLFNRRRIQAKEANLFGHLPPPLTKLMKFYTIMVHLRSMNILAELGKRALYAVSEISEVADLVANERLCTKGQAAQAAFVVIEGFLRVFEGAGRFGRRESNSEVAGMSPRFVDEECLATPDVVKSHQTIVARTPCEVICISKRKFYNVVKEHPNLFASVLFPNQHPEVGSEDWRESFTTNTLDEDRAAGLANVNIDFDKKTSCQSQSHPPVDQDDSPQGTRAVTKHATSTAATISAG